MEKESLRDIVQITQELCTNITEKCFGSIIYTLFIFMFGLDNIIGIVSLIFLLGFHWLTGIISAYKRGEEIVPQRWLKMVMRGFMYMVVVASAHITELSIFHFGKNFFLDEIFIGFLGLTEFMSIVQNMGKMGFAIPNRLLNRLSETRDNLVDNK